MGGKSKVKVSFMYVCQCITSPAGQEPAGRMGEQKFQVAMTQRKRRKEKKKRKKNGRPADIFTDKIDVSDVLEQVSAGGRRFELVAELAGVVSADVGDHPVNGVRHGVNGIHCIRERERVANRWRRTVSHQKKFKSPSPTATGRNRPPKK